VVKNENNELIPTRSVTGSCMCIDYRKLNKATCKDHFSLLFIDQMRERLAKKMGIWVFLKSLSILVTKKRLVLHVRMVHMHIGECHLGNEMPPPFFNIV